MTFSSDCTLNIFLFLIDKRIMFKYNMMIQCSKNKSCICRWFSLPFSVICCSFVCLLVCFNRILVFLRWVCPARVELIKNFEGPWGQKPPNHFFSLSLVFFSSLWIKVQFLYENENKFLHDVTKIQTNGTIDPVESLLSWSIRAGNN